MWLYICGNTLISGCYSESERDSVLSFVKVVLLSI